MKYLSAQIVFNLGVVVNILLFAYINRLDSLTFRAQSQRITELREELRAEMRILEHRVKVRDEIIEHLVEGSNKQIRHHIKTAHGFKFRHAIPLD